MFRKLILRPVPLRRAVVQAVHWNGARSLSAVGGVRADGARTLKSPVPAMVGKEEPRYVRVNKQELEKVILAKGGNLVEALRHMSRQRREQEKGQGGVPPPGEQPRGGNGSVSSEPAPPGWVLGITEEGAAYYFNPATAQTLWHHPSEAPAEEGEGEDGMGEKEEAVGNTAPPSETNVRLNKLIAASGLASRREAEAMIRDSRVSVNGKVVARLSQGVNPLLDTVMVDGVRLPQSKRGSGHSKKLDAAERPRLWAVHKMSGELVSSHDAKKRPLMLDRVRKALQLEPNVSVKPVEHLEYRTEGLCLLSNNGSLARYLGGEKADLDRSYRVRVHGLLTESKLKALRYGAVVGGVKQKGMAVQIDRQGKSTISWISLTAKGTSVKAIRATLEQLHVRALRILCVRIGPFRLDDIPAGSVQELKVPREVTVAWQKS